MTFFKGACKATGDGAVARKDEVAAIESLAAVFAPFTADGGTAGPSGSAADDSFMYDAILETLTAKVCALRIELAPRRYRRAFTVNYQQIFPDEINRHYRADVLLTALRQDMVLWVNGEKFDLSDDAKLRASTLRRTWQELLGSLQCWRKDLARTHGASPPELALSLLQRTLFELDIAWARFEEKYINELIRIEAAARGILMQVAEREQHLKSLEERSDVDGCSAMLQEAECHVELREFVAAVGHINTLANSKRKSRDDLDYSVLECARAALRSHQDRGAAWVLATDVIESFDAFRMYLRKARKHPERVDPQLDQNAGLVERLVDLEESWEVGARYLLHAPTLATIQNAVIDLQQAQRLAPALARMSEDFDVELFLVLPRLLLLFFLASPAQYEELVRSLLPQYFQTALHHVSPRLVPAQGLEEFIDIFHRTRRLHVHAQLAVAGGERAEGYDHTKTKVTPVNVFWEVLVRMAARDIENLGKCHALDLCELVRRAVDDFMRELEWWSIEMQRHCPEKWNQCSAVLLRCWAGQPQDRQVVFRV